MTESTALPSLRYERIFRLQDQRGHTGLIKALAFSPDGVHLASGGEEGHLAIWMLSQRTLRHIYVGTNSINCIRWINLNTLVFGREDGSMCCGQIDEKNSEVTVLTFEAHLFAIKTIDNHDGWCASGASTDLRVWRHLNGTDWRFYGALCQPSSIKGKVGDAVEITHVQWIQGSSLPEISHSAHTLLVTYLHHGIAIWDVTAGVTVRMLMLPTAIGNASVSPDHDFLAVANLTTGYDVYHIQSGSPVASVEDNTCMFSSVPITYLHEGRAILTGGTDGIARMRDSLTGAKLQDFSIENANAVVRSISAYCSEEEDDFWVALGTSYIEVWCTVVNVQPVILVRTDDHSPATNPTHARRRIVVVYAVSLAFVVIAICLPFYNRGLPD